jgi:hypothetical protein
MGSTFSGGRESAFTYGRLLSNRRTELRWWMREQAWPSGNADEAKADVEPIFNLHQDHRFGLKSEIFERFGP